MANPGLELRGEGGEVDFLALLAFLSSVISSFFYPKIGGGALGPLPQFRHCLVISRINIPYTSTGNFFYLISVISSFFYPNIRGGGGLSVPSPRSATVLLFHGLTYHILLQGIFFTLFQPTFF